MTTAIVTGASRGIGRATALELAARGMDVTVTYVRSREAAEDVVGLIRGTGRDAIAVRCDVAEPEDTVTVVDGTVDAFGGVDILVNNAGAYPRQRFGDLSVEDWRRVIEVNLSGAFYMTRACLPHLREAVWGRIVNVSSVLAHMGSSQGAHYAAAKAGLLGLTRSMAREFAPHGITVNAVCPGMTMTDIMAVYPEEELRRRSAGVPLGRIGDPEDVARVVAFLVTEARYMTGAVVDVNGGILMR